MTIMAFGFLMVFLLLIYTPIYSLIFLFAIYRYFSLSHISLLCVYAKCWGWGRLGREYKNKQHNILILNKYWEVQF